MHCFEFCIRNLSLISVAYYFSFLTITLSFGPFVRISTLIFLMVIEVLYIFFTLQEALENNRREITASLLKSFPQLLRKYVPDKAKISPLIDIMLLLKLELYSLKRQEQVGCFAS